MNGWPGLALEVTKLCQALAIEDANVTMEDTRVYIKNLKEACRIRDEVDIKKAMQPMSKMAILNKEDCYVMSSKSQSLESETHLQQES